MCLHAKTVCICDRPSPTDSGDEVSASSTMPLLFSVRHKLSRIKKRSIFSYSLIFSVLGETQKEALHGHMNWCVSVISSQSQIIIAVIMPLIFFPPPFFFPLHFFPPPRASRIFPYKKKRKEKGGENGASQIVSILFAKITFLPSRTVRTPEPNQH